MARRRTIWGSVLLAAGMLPFSAQASETIYDVGVEVTVAVAVDAGCPGIPRVAVPPNTTVSLCYRVGNLTDSEVSAVRVVDGNRTIAVASLAPRAFVDEKRPINAAQAFDTTAAVSASIKGKPARTSVAQATVGVVAFPAGPRAAPTALAELAPTSAGAVWATQPDRIEVVKSDRTLRTCNGKPCACRNSGDVVRVFAPAGHPFPARETDFPGIFNGLEVGCRPAEATWGRDVIELKGDALDVPGGLVAIRQRSTVWRAGLDIFRDRCLAWKGHHPSGDFPGFATLPRPTPPASFLPGTPSPGHPALQIPRPVPRPMPNVGCNPGCTAFCVAGGGGCKNELVVGEGAGVQALWAGNGWPAWSSPSAVPAPKRQWVKANQPIEIDFRVNEEPGFPLLDATLVRDDNANATVLTTFVTEPHGIKRGHVTVAGITRKTTFTLKTRTSCGENTAFSRSITLLPETSLVVEGADPIVLGPGERVTVNVRANGSASSVDVGLILSEETPPPGSDIFPHATLSADALSLAASGAAQPITISLEDSNTGIDAGTLLATIEFRPRTATAASEWREVRYRAPLATGFAETHAHPFAHVAFGAKDGLGHPNPLGGGILGDPDGPDSDLANCTYAHGAFGLEDPYGLGFSVFAPHGNDGAPSFKGWPAFTTGTHQQMKTAWIKRAYDGGLRVMVALAVENRMLCAIKRSGLRTSELVQIGVMKLGTGPMLAPLLVPDPALAVPTALALLDPFTAQALLRLGGAYASCNAANQMASISAQLALARAFAANNPSWVRIVITGQEADQAIRDEKLALVLGVEMGPLFGCEKDATTCDAKFVKSNVEAFHALGVRYVFMTHKEDNHFGGAANMPLTNVKTEKCPLVGSSDCNVRGLTDAGGLLLDELIEKGWFVDIGHMSLKMKDDVLRHLRDLKRLRGVNYPLISGHAAFLEFEREDGRHEGAHTAGDVDAVRESGGMVSPILDPGASSTSFDYGNAEFGRAWSCVHSSDTWAQQLRYALRYGRGRAVGLGTDMDGFGGLVAPQYGALRCASGKGPDFGVPKEPPPYVPVMVSYPLQFHFVRPDGGRPTATPLGKMKIGATREYDVNYDGVAQFGMLPDFIDELALRGSDVDPLMRSADAFARVWRKIDCEATRKRNGPAAAACPR